MPLTSPDAWSEPSGAQASPENRPRTPPHADSCQRHDLATAGDMAAVLYWRLTALTPTDPGPLPWLPGIPPTLHAHPVWGAYLAKRSQLVPDLADQVQDHACQGHAGQSGHHREVTQHRPRRRNRSVARRQRHQSPRPATNRRRPNSKRSPPSGNNASTGISRVPPTRGRCEGRRATGSTHRT